VLLCPACDQWLGLAYATFEPVTMPEHRGENRPGSARCPGAGRTPVEQEIDPRPDVPAVPIASDVGAPSRASSTSTSATPSTGAGHTPQSVIGMLWSIVKSVVALVCIGVALWNLGSTTVSWIADVLSWFADLGSGGNTCAELQAWYAENPYDSNQYIADDYAYRCG
jgi:hypothetical protein